MNNTLNTIKQTLILSMLPVAAGAQAACLPDAPEIGDIGPSSEVVCGQLEDRFAAADLAVEDRSLQSPTEVSVLASADGAPVYLHYALTGYTWRLTAVATSAVKAPIPLAGLSPRTP